MKSHKKHKEIILVSASPRRAELLKQIGLPFTVLKLDFTKIEDSPELNSPRISNNKKVFINEDTVFSNARFTDFVEKISKIKLQTALFQLKNKLKFSRAIVICADTIVELDGEIIGKPKNKKEAFIFLDKMSGRSHNVYTGLAVGEINSRKTYISHAKTEVIFKKLTKQEIKNYIATGEPFDKAGGYGIQEKGAVFVSAVKGCYFNVVGLPINKLISILDEEFNIKISDLWR